MSKEAISNKRRREDDSDAVVSGSQKKRGTSHNEETSSASPLSHDKIMACLRENLSSLHKTETSQTISKNAFQSQMADFRADRQLLQQLQASLPWLQSQVDTAEKDYEASFSRFKAVLMDEGVCSKIVSFLDEAGLWVLEDSNVMMKVDGGEAFEKHWERLWKRNPRPLPISEEFSLPGENPARSSDSRNFVNEGAEDAGIGQELPASAAETESQVAESSEQASQEMIEKPVKCDYRTRGRLFAEASRMARCMEELAHKHYQATPLAKADEKKHNPYTWPKNMYKSRDHFPDCHQIRFVRLACAPTPSEDPIIVEGFWKVSNRLPEPSYFHGCCLFRGYLCAEKSSKDDGLDRFLKKYASVVDSEQCTVEDVRKMAQKISVTVLDLYPRVDGSSGETEIEMQLAFSTVGGPHIDEIEDVFWLESRSGLFQERQPSHRLRFGAILEVDRQEGVTMDIMEIVSGE